MSGLIAINARQIGRSDPEITIRKSVIAHRQILLGVKCLMPIDAEIYILTCYIEHPDVFQGAVVELGVVRPAGEGRSVVLGLGQQAQDRGGDVVVDGVGVVGEGAAVQPPGYLGGGARTLGLAGQVEAPPRRQRTQAAGDAGGQGVHWN
ncbi:hypothetical protein CDAR_242571 [Caerostris darwini]|uniref:Uncharacterized protein n=1 Tax=Caerostris darwini TaxID=1538125 RepID=A0AAV4W4U1_9ARAC|nr:hypothetical protein CDAR_242571 [Caerostris darwini]